MLFKLYLQDKERSCIGHEWLEVLAIVPFRFTQHGICHECGHSEEDGPYWIAQAWFYCRTESGLAQLAEDDVMHEVYQGIYCEAGGEEKAKEQRERFAECMAAIEDEEDEEDEKDA